MNTFFVGGVEMSSPLILAAGAAKHPSQVLPYLHPDAPLGAAISGSYTLEPRNGNTGELVWPADIGELLRNSFGLNAYGMPNIGLREAIKLFPQGQMKPHLISLAGVGTPEKSGTAQIIEMLEALKGNEHIAGVEINGGCPNTGHLPVSYMLKDLANLLAEVNTVRFDKPIWLKLSPYMTVHELGWLAREYPLLDFRNTPTVREGFVDELCELLAEHPQTISAVVMTNTLPNVVYKDGNICVHTSGGFHRKAGLSGPILRDHNLKLISQMVENGLTSDIDIIGCGGVMTGDHALAYLHAGCVGVACASGPAWSDAKFFQHILEGSEGLQEHLYNN